MDAVMNYIAPELLVLVPVLYLIGMGLKRATAVRDEYIPLLLGLGGIVLSVLWLLSTTAAGTSQEWAAFAFTGIVQGILCAGAAVYCNQLGKQAQKARREEVIRDGEAHQS